MSGEPFTGQPPNRAEASKRITHPEDGSQAAWLLEERIFQHWSSLGAKLQSDFITSAELMSDGKNQEAVLTSLWTVEFVFSGQPHWSSWP